MGSAAAARSPPYIQAGSGRAATGRLLGAAYLNATAFTASVILCTIRSASSVPCRPLNPFIAATIPTISSETSRIRPTYSTVPCPRSPSSAATIPRVRRRNCVWMYADSLASMDASRGRFADRPGHGHTGPDADVSPYRRIGGERRVTLRESRGGRGGGPTTRDDDE